MVILQTCLSECVPQYVALMDFKSLNGEQMSANSVAECQTACDNRPECVGYDFVSPDGCWLRVNLANAVMDAPSSEGVTHYRLVWNCAGTHL